MSMIPHRVRGSHPSQKSTHFTVHIRTQNQMPMIRHQLIRIQRDAIPFQSFRNDSFECGIVLVFPKDLRSEIPAIERMIQSARFIGALWSWHDAPNHKSTPYALSMSPDPFEFSGEMNAQRRTVSAYAAIRRLVVERISERWSFKLRVGSERLREACSRFAVGFRRRVAGVGGVFAETPAIDAEGF